MIKFIVHLKSYLYGINIDSMKEALPKFSIYKNIIAKFIDEINSKYDMAMTCLQLLEHHELGHWSKTFQVASGNSKAPKPPRP